MFSLPSGSFLFFRFLAAAVLALVVSVFLFFSLIAAHFLAVLVGRG